MKVAVLVAPAAHPVSGRPCAGEAELAALALAGGLSTELTVLYAGAAEDAALADYLAQGAAAVRVLAVEAGQDILPALIEAVKDHDLILCGGRAGNGAGSGMLPYLLAEALERPLLPDAMALEVCGKELRITQGLAKGVRRTLSAALPLVSSVDKRAASAGGWSYAALRQGAIRRQQAAGPAFAQPRREPARRARALVAASRASGHDRMLGAIAGSDGKQPGRVVKQGDPVEKAQVVLEYLRHHQLVDF